MDTLNLIFVILMTITWILYVNTSPCEFKAADFQIGRRIPMWECNISNYEDFKAIPLNATVLSLSIDTSKKVNFNGAILPKITNLRRLTVDVRFLAFYSNNTFTSQPIDTLEYLEIKKFVKDVLLSKIPNHLVLYPGYFKNVPKVKELILRGAGITDIPNGTFDGLTSLRTLDLSHNSIQKIPVGAFSNLSNLKELRLQNNFINYYSEDGIQPGSFNGLDNLYWLNLDKNNIQGLTSGWFNGLSKLQYLFLKESQISDAHADAFAGLTRLKYIMLCGNSFTRIPTKTFTTVKNLDVLDLSENKLNYVYRGDFTNAGSIEILYLQKNNIESLDEGTFDGLGKLRELYLQGNKITNINRDYLTGMPNLGRLDLSANIIFSLSRTSFLDVPLLKVLYLNKNRLETLSEGTFENNQELMKLEISDNAWRCDCGIFWMFRWTCTREWPTLEFSPYNAKCSTPAMCNGLTFSHMIGDCGNITTCDEAYFASKTTTTTITMVTTVDQNQTTFEIEKAGNHTPTWSESHFHYTNHTWIYILIMALFLVFVSVLIVICCLKYKECCHFKLEKDIQCEKCQQNHKTEMHLLPANNHIIAHEPDYIIFEPKPPKSCTYNKYDSYVNEDSGIMDTSNCTDTQNSNYHLYRWTDPIAPLAKFEEASSGSTDASGSTDDNREDDT